MRIAAFLHVPFENPGCIREWAAKQGHDLTEVQWFAGQRPPAPVDFDCLVVLGGPMSVRDEDRFPWLLQEKRFIGGAIDEGKLVLGICFGAQLAADVLGASVAPMSHKEVGWFPVTLEASSSESPFFRGLSSPVEVFHWHGEMFEIPPGAVHLAGSEGCVHQIFTLGNHVIGIQCHPEMTPAGATALADHCPGDLASGPWAQTREEVLRDGGRFERAHAWMERLLTNMETYWTAHDRKTTRPGL